MLRLLPQKIANSILARFINKLKWSYNPNLFKNVKLKYSTQLKMNLCNTDVGHRYIAFTGVYEIILTKKLYHIAKHEGGVLIDVGANYGYYSLLWSQFPKNTSYAFEASPRNFSHLVNNIALNNLADNTNTFQLAISNATGELTFDLGPEEQTGWGGLNHLKNNTETNTNIVKVKSITLDNFITEKNLDKITVLKIDTEGSDVLVLEGALSLIKEQRIKHIFFEENKTRMDELGLSSNQMIETLKEVGYIVEKFDNSEFYAYLP